jgi:hypothetical protein
MNTGEYEYRLALLDQVILSGSKQWILLSVIICCGKSK